MANVPKTSRCLNCDSPIESGRLKRFRNAVLCGSLDCHVAHNKRWRLSEPLYELPADGSPDSADPLFRKKVRACGRCNFKFTTTPRWRYFCERCRESASIKNPPTDRPYAISSGRRSGGG